MNRFNLTFSGEIKKGEQPDAVKRRFAKKFAIEDPDRLERFFSGNEIILRRNLDRKQAAESFQEMGEIGVVATLVKVSAEEAAAATPPQAEETREVEPEPQPRPPQATPDNTASKKAPSPDAAPHNAVQPAAEEAADVAATEHEALLAAERDAREAAEARCVEAEREAEQLRADLSAALNEREAGDEERVASARAEADAARRQAQDARAAAQQEAAQHEQARRDAESESARLAEREAKAVRLVEKTRRLLEQERRKAKEATRRADELARRNADLETERHEAVANATALETALRETTERARREAAKEKARTDKRLAREQTRLAKEEARLARTAAEQEARLERELREAQARAEQREAALAGAVQRAEQQLRESREAERRAREGAQRALAEAREQLLLEEQARAMEEQAVDRAVTALSGRIALGPARASTRTSLGVRQANGGERGEGSRRRPPGEPNFYSLKPFRNTKAVRERAALAGHAARRLASLGALAVAALAALTGAYLNVSPAPAVSNVTAVAVTPAGGPVILAGDRLFLHDRAGAPESELALADLGVASLRPPMAFEENGALLALGAPGRGAETQLLRCDLGAGACAALPLLPDDVTVATFTLNPVNGELFLIDAAQDALLRVAADGSVLARASLAVPERPVLRLHAGLLLLRSDSASALRVLRYDTDAFGEQLDEIALAPPPAVAAQHSRVGDFLFSGGAWWVTLYNPENDSAGLYRFDNQWQYLDEAALGHPALPIALTRWADKTLVNDGRSTALARFNPGGGVEVPFTSKPLDALADNSRLRIQLTESAWRVGLVALALAALLAFAGAYLQRLRHLVYRSARERGAEPVDDLLDSVHWIGAAAGRESTLRTRLLSYSAIAAALLLIAAGQRVGGLQLTALLLFLLGPGIALALLARSSTGHLGVAGERLLLVEPAGTYHLGGGASLLYRGNLLFIDDVALYTGSALLPAFCAEEVSSRVEPLVAGGVRIDARTALTRLLQSQHPLARGLRSIAACTFGALALALLGGIF